MKTVRLTLFLLFSVVLLAGCGGIYFSPESAAVGAVHNSGDPQFTVDRDSVNVRQSLQMSDQSVVVMITFQGKHVERGAEGCMNAYRVVKWRLGWQPSSGGGSCSTLNPQAGALESLEIGSSQSTSDQPGDPGFSQVYGMVHDAQIVKVRVTWNDGQADEVDVIDDSFVASRLGLFEMQQIQGLDADGQAVYDFIPQVAPGKR